MQSVSITTIGTNVVRQILASADLYLKQNYVIWLFPADIQVFLSNEAYNDDISDILM